MVRLRNAPGIYALIKEADPDSAVTLGMIRALLNSGKVPVTRVGKKILADADLVMEALGEGGELKTTKEAKPARVLYPIPENIRRCE